MFFYTYSPPLYGRKIDKEMWSPGLKLEIYKICKHKETCGSKHNKATIFVYYYLSSFDHDKCYYLPLYSINHSMA